VGTGAEVEARSGRVHAWTTAAGTSLRRAWPALAAYVVVRLVGFFWLAIRLSPPVLRQHLTDRYDSRYYTNIAVHGYNAVLRDACTVQGPHCQYAFFPLYPMLIRALHVVVPVSPGYLGLAIAVVSALVAAWGIFAVTDLVAGRRAGAFAAIVWGVLPHAVVENIAYSESLFTALAAWSLYWVLRRHWLAAAVLAVLAGLTRPSGIAVVSAVEVGLLAAWWDARRTGGPGSTPRLVAAAVIAPLGWAGWLAYVGYRTHAWNGYVREQNRWRTGFDLGRYTLHAFADLFNGGTLKLDTVEVAATTVVAVVLLVLSVLDRQPPALLAYSFVAVVLAVGTSGYFWSKSRFLLIAFPLGIPIAKAFARTRPATAVTVVAVATALSARYGVYLLGAVRASP
jgi:hypothetical protein